MTIDSLEKGIFNLSVNNSSMQASMKSFVIFFCAILVYASLSAQQKGGKRIAGHAASREDTAYVDSLNEQSTRNYLYNPDSSRALAEKALILATQIQYVRGEGFSYAAIGYTYWAQSYYPLSLYYLFNALEFLKASKEHAQLSMCNRIIARDYIEMKKYAVAAAYLHDAELNAGLSKNNFAIELVYNESSLLDLRQKKYGEARAKCMTALTLCGKNKDTLLTGIIYSRLANIAKQSGQATLIKNYYDTALRWALLAKNNRLRALILTHYAELYLSANNIANALKIATDACQLADSIGNMELKLEAAAVIPRAYNKANNPNLELKYGKEYNALQDSVSEVYKQKNFQLLQQFFTLNKRLRSVEEQEHDNTINQERIRFQRVVISALMVFVAILLAGLFTIYYLYNEKRRIANQLADRNNAITEQKNIIEEQSVHLSQLNDLKTKLFAVISHDLRTPISSLRSIMGLFQQDGLTEEQTVLLLKRMLPALDGADLTLSNLLNWSIKQMNGLKINRLSVSILPMAEEIQNVFEFALQQKGIRLDIQLPTDAKVYVDEHHLKIILRNLVSNAIKFTPQNGTIIIGESASGGKTTIWVKDNGKGIRAEDLPKLFTATTNFTTKGTSGEKGTGLGLVLCKELLELNNGTIYVESVEGTGSTFYFVLPEKE